MPERERRVALEVVDRIYDAALTPALWPRALQEVMDFVGGSKGLLFTPLTSPASGGFAVPHAISGSMLQQWEARYLPHDVWAHAGEVKQFFQDGNVVLDAELVPEREFLRSVVYRELLEPAGIARLCCGIIFGRPRLPMVPTVCSIFRAHRERPFGETERRRLKLMVPHLSRAFGITFRLRDAEFRLATTQAALDRIGTGVVLLDGSGRMIFVNPAAQRALEDAGSGFERALSACLDVDALEVPHFSQGIRVPRSSGRHDFVVQFAPLPPENDLQRAAGGARMVLFITDPDVPVVLDSAMLKRLYGLTTAEIALAQSLLAGDGLLEAAKSRGIGEATARTHLKRVFEKTATHRQADLIKLLLSLGSGP